MPATQFATLSARRDRWPGRAAACPARVCGRIASLASCAKRAYRGSCSRSCVALECGTIDGAMCTRKHAAAEHVGEPQAHNTGIAGDVSLHGGAPAYSRVLHPKKA